MEMYKVKTNGVCEWYNRFPDETTIALDLKIHITPKLNDGLINARLAFDLFDSDLKLTFWLEDGTSVSIKRTVPCLI